MLTNFSVTVAESADHKVEVEVTHNYITIYCFFLTMLIFTCVYESHVDLRLDKMSCKFNQEIVNLQAKKPRCAVQIVLFNQETV